MFYGCNSFSHDAQLGCGRVKCLAMSRWALNKRFTLLKKWDPWSFSHLIYAFCIDSQFSAMHPCQPSRPF